MSTHREDEEFKTGLSNWVTAKRSLENAHNNCPNVEVSIARIKYKVKFIVVNKFVILIFE
jgi:hypothetical protein